MLKNNESINHPTLNKIIEKAQKKNEYQNYSIRRILFEFDSVVDKQRNIVYAQRDVIMGSDDIRSGVFDIVGIYTEYCIDKLKVAYNKALYIGDNPRKDFITANKLGMHTIRIVRDEGIYSKVIVSDEYNAKRTIHCLSELIVKS